MALPAQVTIPWPGADLLTVLNPATVASGDTLAISTTADHFLLATALVNNGTITWVDAGSIRAWNGASLTNNSAFNDQNMSAASIYSDFDGNFVFNNAGTYTKSGAATTTISIALTNTGSVAVNAGTLVLQGGGSNASTATFTTAGSAVTQFNNNYALADGSALTGAGTYLLSNGTLSASGNLTVTKLNLFGGTLAGTHTFDHSTLDWNGGTSLSTGGTTTIASTSVLHITNTADHFLLSRTLANQGTVNWSGAGNIRAWNGGVITNSGTFNDQNTSAASIYSDFDGNFSFTNNGSYLKTGTGSTNIAIQFTNNNGHVLVSGGTLRFAGNFQQNSGTVELRSGATAQFDGGLAFAAGHLIGSGTVIGNVNNYGLFAPVDFNITGNLTLEATSGLAFKLGGTTAGVGGYNHLAVTGTVALDGYLSLAFEKGFETSVTAADAFTLLNTSSLAGAFDNVANGGRLATTDGFGSFQVNYAGSLLTLSNFTPVPEPSTVALIVTGLALLGLSTRRRRD